MRYYALATDYDGTIAEHGRVAEATVQALEEVHRSGRRLILVTGRILDDLQRAFPRLDLFERVVAENGAVVHAPATRETRLLAEAPPSGFVRELERRGTAPLVTGRVIVATVEPNEKTVLETIRDLGLELHVIFNKGAVMVLPSGVNKATGLLAALDDLEISPHNVAGIGDAENDHAFLALCECAAAVADALPVLKEKADLVTRAGNGPGVIELARALIDSDLEEFEPRLARHRVPLGMHDGEPITVPPYGVSVLLAGTSGSGKSTLTQGFLERLAGRRYQYCVIDPEGDYAALEGAVVLGDSKRVPGVQEVISLLEDPARNGVANLLGVPLAGRPEYLEALLHAVTDLRSRTGHPHWIVIDEAHHALPVAPARAPQSVPRRLQGAFLITVHPNEVAREVLQDVGLVLAVGREPAATLKAFAESVGARPPRLRDEPLEPGEAMAWQPADPKRAPLRFRVEAPRGERLRHRRKYTEGELAPDRSFYFRGPGDRLNLRVQNLSLFNQIAEGVDDETWLHHLLRGDYSRWFREQIKDDDLAREAAAIELDAALSPDRSRALIRAVIESRYTAPAESAR
jgi:hydroxymethylpyrimidine pyrophosphatase-like HAD family hydrolase